MIIKRFGFALGLAAVFLALAAGLRFAAAEGLVADDLARRLVQTVIGLGLAAFGNVMPKQIGGLRASAAAETRAQSALRVGGWAMTLAGLAHASLWAFAPLGFADTASMIVVGGALVVTAGYAVWCFSRGHGGRSARGA